jgi:hypothetical protein
VVISATKDGVKFTTAGDVGTGNITVRQNTTADKVRRVAWWRALRSMWRQLPALPLQPSSSSSRLRLSMELAGHCCSSSSSSSSTNPGATYCLMQSLLAAAAHAYWVTPL